MSKAAYWLICVGLLLAAAWLRFVDLGSIPVGIYWDEVAMLVDAKSVAETGLDMHGRPWYQVMYPSYGDYKLPIYIWLASISVNLFGVSAWALRLPSAIAGLATIGIAGAIAYQSLTRKENYPRRVALWSMLATMLVLAVSPWSLMFSRTAFEGHVGQLLLATSLACLLASKYWSGWRWISPVIGAVATYAYFSVRFVWPVVFIAMTIWLWYEESKTEGAKTRQTWLHIGFQAFIRLVLPLIVFAVLLLPMVNSPLYQDSNRFRLGTDSVLKNEAEILQSNVYREIAGNQPLDRLLFHRWWLTGRELLLNYSDNLSLRFIFVTGDPNLRHGTGEFGLFIWPLLLFFIIGWYYLFTHHRGWAAVLGSWWLAALLPASVPDGTPHALRALNSLVPLSLVIGTGIAASLDALWRRRPERVTFSAANLTWILSVAAFKVVVLACIFVTISFFNLYFTVYPVRSAPHWQAGFPELAQAVDMIRENHPVYVEIGDDKFYLWMMAYGPYGGAEYHSWPSFKYQFKSFDNILFTPFPGWSNVLNGDTRVVVVGQVESVDEVVGTHNTQVVREEVVNSPDGEPLFKVVLMDKKL